MEESSTTRQQAKRRRFNRRGQSTVAGQFRQTPNGETTTRRTAGFASPSGTRHGYSTAANTNSIKESAPAPPPTTSTSTEPAANAAATPRFAELAGLVHPDLLATITGELKFEHMTPVQAATIHQLLTKRVDVLAQAKTGTGKTLAFLIPAIQQMIKRKPVPGKGISILVISPTRELALQITREARSLLTRFRYKVDNAIGGTNPAREARSILGHCDILVATPGRLWDHMSGENALDICDRLAKLDTLVLDEADRLLDMGFVKDLQTIISRLPSKKESPWQGMLFSATVTPHLKKVSNLALSQGYEFISTIPEGEARTHERVPQQLVVVPQFSGMAAALVATIRQEMATAGSAQSESANFKAIIFAPTAAHVDFYAHVLEQLPGLPSVARLHSRLSQSKRTKTTSEYRSAKNAVLVATDVVARGMDFPGVTHVIQAGLPSDAESYIHRLGRTARAGAEGRGVLILTSHELFFTKSKELKDVKMIPNDVDVKPDEAKIAAIASAMEPEMQKKVYQAFLGYYKSVVKSLQWDAARLVAEGNKYALQGLGATEVPALDRKIVGKMGLKGTPGLRFETVEKA